MIENFTSTEVRGYVLYTEKPTPKDSVDDPSNDGTDKTKNDGGKGSLSDIMNKILHSDNIFEEFQPHLLKQHQNRPRLSYENFSMTVNKFFSLLVLFWLGDEASLVRHANERRDHALMAMIDDASEDGREEDHLSADLSPTSIPPIKKNTKQSLGYDRTKGEDGNLSELMKVNTIKKSKMNTGSPFKVNFDP